MKAILNLILWPSIITLMVSLLRLYLQVQGSMSSQSGGGLALLGITWLVFLFGSWFGWCLFKQASQPSLRRGALWALLPMIALVCAVMLGFGNIDQADQSDAAYASLRATVVVIVIVAVLAAGFCFVIWPRLAFAMLLYAIPARLTVLAITYLAKQQDWDTHYTKFGPAGIERDLGETMYAASVAQMGFWVCFTVVGGVLAGTITTPGKSSTA
ncbi:MAG: hypothetical protein ACYTG5_23165 [Planctomycetota bacterium]|jgi:hypothetical protein